MIGSMVDQVINGHVVVGDSLNISSLKVSFGIPITIFLLQDPVSSSGN